VERFEAWSQRADILAVLGAPLPQTEKLRQLRLRMFGPLAAAEETVLPPPDPHQSN